MKNKLFLLLFITTSIFGEEHGIQLPEENLSVINKEKVKIKEEIEKKVFKEELALKLKEIKEATKNLKVEKTKLDSKIDGLKLIEDRLVLFKKEIEGLVQSKTIKSFEGIKPSVSAEIITEMYKNDKKSTIKLLILQKKEILTSIIKKMEPVDAAKIMKDLINYKQKF